MLNGMFFFEINSTKINQTMKRYSKKSQDKVEEVMHEFKTGELKSGKDGKGGVVKNRKQAIAIGLSEARAEGAKVPESSNKVVSKRSSKKEAESSTEKKSRKSETTGRTSSSKIKSRSAGKTVSR